MKNTWRADPLVWGHGPRVFEVFLEPTCPFSVKAFGKLDDLLGQAGEQIASSGPPCHSGTNGLQTPRWREVDSNFQFRARNTALQRRPSSRSRGGWRGSAANSAPVSFLAEQGGGRRGCSVSYRLPFFF
jgi:hypothetical protein